MKGDTALFLLVLHIGLILIVTKSFGDCKPAYIGKIMNGSDALPGEFPYQVSIQAIDYPENKWVPVCGGSILNPTTILTAAHCIRFGAADHPSPFRIVAGEHNLDVPEGTEQIREVKKVIVHGDWDEFTYHSDVALFVMSHPLLFNSNVQAIKLPPSKHTPAGEGMVTGWGTDGEHAPIRNVLQKLKIPIYDAQKCREVYGDDFTVSMICAGKPTGYEDACKGDSGGPLAATDLGYQYVAGIVSWGVGCGRPGYLGVYTKVSHFTAWIEYAIRKIHER